MTTRDLLAVPDSGALAPDLVHKILEYVEGVRVDVESKHLEKHDRMWAQAHALAAVPECFPIFLLFGGDMTRGGGAPWEPDGMLAHLRDECEKLKIAGFLERELAIEFGNEPDLGHKRFKKNPRELGDLYGEAMRIVWEHSPKWHCLSPSISNLDEDSLDYLRKMHLPIGAEIAFHRYPNGKDFWAPQRGFKTRGDEVAKLKEIAKGAKLWHTEGGFAQWNEDYKLSEDEQATLIGGEIRFWHDVGVEAFTLYQLNDGSWKESDSGNHKRLSTYGIRKLDGTWKRAAYTTREVRAELG